MLPPGSVVRSATVKRLAPNALPAPAHAVEGGSPADDRTSHVLFRPASGGVWTPGVYQLAVVWADADGLHDRAWHAELRPGPVRETPRLLAAARSWARYAGASGVILGTAEPLEGGPSSSTIRLLRIRPDDGTAYPATGGVGCGGTVVDGQPGIIGFAYPADGYLARVSGRILRPFLRSGEQVLMSAAFGVPGLILVAPARNPTLPLADWRFIVGDGPDPPTYALCLGMAAFDD